MHGSPDKTKELRGKPGEAEPDLAWASILSTAQRKNLGQLGSISSKAPAAGRKGRGSPRKWGLLGSAHLLWDGGEVVSCKSSAAIQAVLWGRLCGLRVRALFRCALCTMYSACGLLCKMHKEISTLSNEKTNILINNGRKISGERADGQ